MCAPCLYLRVRPPRAAIDSGGPTTVPGAVKLSDLPPNELLTDKRSLYIRKHFAVIVRYHEDGLAIPRIAEEDMSVVASGVRAMCRRSTR